MKKFLALFLGICLVFNLGGVALASEGKAELPKFKIAFLYGEFTSKLGEQFVTSLESIADEMNVEIVRLEGGFGEQTISTIESAVATGQIDGIISASGASPAFLAAADGVPFVASSSSFPSDPAEVAEVASYENFLGGIIDSDYNAGYSAAEALYAAGCRNLCVAGLTQGMSAAHDARIQGVMDFLKDHPDFVLLSDNYSRAQYAPAISAFAAAFPEMDSLFTSSCDDAVFTTMMTEGLLGSVKLGTVDITESTGSYFDNGLLAYVAGGQYGSAMVAFSILYNYLADGTRIIQDTNTPMQRNYLVVHNAEEFAQYIECVDGEIPVYTAAEIKEMVHYYNEAAGYDSIQAINDAYSIEDILARHAGLLP